MLSVAVWMLLTFFSVGNIQADAQYIGARQRLRQNPLKAPIAQRGDQPPPLDPEEAIPFQEIHPLADIIKLQRQGFIFNTGYEPKKLHPCEQSSCYPATGNLLIGRESQLYASSTCGLYGQQRYCIVSHLDAERKKCFWCDSRPSNKPNPLYNHNISNIVYRMYPGTRQRSWWQSENGKEKVYIQLDLEAEFHFTHLIITFKTFRPAAMLIERSYDFKQTWQVYRYFAQNCTESFPGIREGHPRNLTDIVCESRYSSLEPATDGEVIYRVLPPTMPIDNPYSQEVQNLLKMTNLRINFTKLHKLGDDLLDQREEIQEKYYYAITDMVVRGSCSCYGHANRCLPLPGIDPKSDMVHGRCECTHNTKGRNCEKCEDFFNDLPWRPAIGKQTHACKRCNCNNHATSCHFDAALYDAKGKISGGVCDGCQHNTMGPNCEQCKPFFYKDPQRDIQDPEVCRPCDCDPHGSLDGGICDSVTDPVNNLEAGSCHCKTNVEGRRCDICKNGYWNFTDANPDGCQECTCNTLGTIGNQGCNVVTGECTCKRYVTGRDCFQCLPEYWGLSDKRDGCEPCNCDPGGSLDNNCDVISGQCRCRNNMTGRKCDIPQQQFFTANLDFLLYEAEASRTNGQVVIREPYRDGRTDTWTGTGFVRVFEGNYIEFIVDDILTSMEYNTIIRYEPTIPDSWEEVLVTVHRPGQVNPDGPCAHINPEDDVKPATLSSNSRSVLVPPPTCFERGKTYKVRLEFRRSRYEKETPTASVLIDSLVLIPRIDNMPMFNGSTPAETRRREFDRFNCGHYSNFEKGAQVPEVCKNYYKSIGAYIFNGAFPCQCDPTGSISKICDPHGGYCTCKVNVVGRRCDRCAPATYGFGPEGCKSCDCNNIGAADNQCNATTGQCKCKANTYGKACDQCRTGFWNFPHCERCDCNGHADICEAQTGVCINCRENTQGDHCDYCIEGYYGDPRLIIDIPCRPCPCPGPVGSNHSYAERCTLDPINKDVICECQEGYAGARCDVCSDNFYGNPELPGGSCTSCECSEKIDLFQPGNCDPHTGKCLKCLYETAGDHCEVCRSGYFRYSEDRMCEECVCNYLGTNFTAGPCNPSSGQCNCFPNVSGLRCDACIDNHWKIASGEGCEPCDCDPLGSLSLQCNEFDGQCQCKPGFGGRQCNECMPRFYGDPKIQCQECQCDALGAKTEQCDMRSGDCICLLGVGGPKCDRCERGYTGSVPNCDPCGECFDNWDRILKETGNRTVDIIERAGDIKKVGATGAYTKEFDEMQAQLDEIEQLLNNTDDIDVEAIEEELQILRDQLNETEHDKLNKLDNDLDNIKQKNYFTERKVNRLNESIADLKQKTKELENNGTKLQEANVQGALTLINNAKEKADRAAHKAEHSQGDIKYAENLCRATEKFINDTEKSYKKTSEDNQNALDSIREKLDTLNSEFPELNDMVCDKAGDPCDPICGGAGCGTCGNSISCENGAKQQAETAISLANKSETVLRNKEALANDLIRNVSQINTNETRTLAQETFDKINNQLTKANYSLQEASALLKEMREYLNQNNTKPEDIKKLAQQVLAKNVQKTPEEVKELAENIKEAVDRLTNTDAIIEATKNDLAKVNELKEDAKSAKKNATRLLTDAEKVNIQLNKTQVAQREAEEAIEKALEDYKAVENILNEIGNKTEVAQETTSDIDVKINTLKDRLTDLQRNITENANFANLVITESENIMKHAQKTDADSKELQKNYNIAKVKLEENLNKVKSTKERSNELFTKALNLVAKVTKTQEDIQKLEESSQGGDLTDLENQLQALIRKMNGHTVALEGRVQHYKTCT